MFVLCLSNFFLRHLGSRTRSRRSCRWRHLSSISLSFYLSTPFSSKKQMNEEKRAREIKRERSCKRPVRKRKGTGHGATLSTVQYHFFSSSLTRRRPQPFPAWAQPQTSTHAGKNPQPNLTHSPEKYVDQICFCFRLGMQMAAVGEIDPERWVVDRCFSGTGDFFFFCMYFHSALALKKIHYCSSLPRKTIVFRDFPKYGEPSS
jgi:hypothetical protein